METKNQQITGSLEKVLGQVETVVDNLHAPIMAINFKESLSDNDIEKLRLHLGYTKNYSDLAKTRLIYSRIADYDQKAFEIASARTEITAPRIRTTKKGTTTTTRGGVRTPKLTRKAPLEDKGNG